MSKAWCIRRRGHSPPPCAASGLRRRPGEDRRHLPVDRQCGERRPIGQGRRRARRRDRQHCASRAQGDAARRDGRPAQSRRRQDRARRGRPSGQSASRPAADDPADHPGPCRRHARLISFLGVAGRHRRRRAAGHSVSRRRFGRRQYHRARLQIHLPHHADRARFRQGLCRLPQRREEIRPEDRQHRRGQREHRLRHLGLRQHPRRRQGRQHQRRGAYHL